MHLTCDLAVVPIFVNAGAALLPAIVGGAVQAVSLLLKPRQLLRVFRRRPWIPVILAAIGFLGWLGGRWLLSESAPVPIARVDQAVDWSAVGRQIVRAREYAAHAATLPTTQRASALTDFIMGGDASRRSYDGGPVPVGLAAEPLWSHGEPDTFYLTTPAVRNGKVFAGSCQLDLAGKFGYLFAADARTGRLIWKKTGPTKDEPFKAFFSSPALTRDGRSLIVGQGLHDNADCSLICLDTETGDLRWQVPTPLHLESSPAIHGDLAVIGAGAIEDANHTPIGNPGFVLAVDISTGRERWRYSLPDPESAPAIDADGVVYIGSGFNGNALVALRSESDADLKAKSLPRLIWKTAAPYPVVGSVTLAGDLAIVGAGNSDFINADPRPAGLVMAVDRKTGVVRWKQEMGDAVLGSIAYSDGKLACPVRTGEVVLLEATTGRVLWRVKVGGGAPILAGVAFAGSRIYAVNKLGQLHVLSAADGRPAEPPRMVNAKSGEYGFALSGPFIAEGRLYVGSETGGVRCYVPAR